MFIFILYYIQEKDWSPSLEAVFNFAKSCTYGVCNCKLIQLDIISYNILIKICCYKGAIFCAIEILHHNIPNHNNISRNNIIKPNTITYNTILVGLARIVDVNMMNDL